MAHFGPPLKFVEYAGSWNDSNTTWGMPLSSAIFGSPKQSRPVECRLVVFIFLITLAHSNFFPFSSVCKAFSLFYEGGCPGFSSSNVSLLLVPFASLFQLTGFYFLR